MPGQTRVDPREPLEVADVVLRDRMRPADDAMEYRQGRDAHRRLQLGVNGLHQTVVVPVHHLGPMPAAAHGTQQHETVGRAVGINRGTPLHAQ